MRDICTESIVTIIPGKQDVLFKYILIVLIAVSLILTMFYGIVGLIATAVFGLLLKHQLMKTDAEYEYIHTNDVFDVDMIICNNKRKQVCSVNLNNVELVAKADTDEITSYGQLIMKDCSGNHASGNAYAIIYREGGRCQKLLIQMDDQMRKSLKQWIPEKVR